MFMLRLSSVAILALVAVGCSRPTQISKVLAPCTMRQGPANAVCGVLDVWEDRAAKRGRRIPLKIVVLPSLQPSERRPPLMVLAGGPGQGAAALVHTWRRQLAPVQRTRDIVLVDTRGTGASHPLECRDADPVIGNAGSDAHAIEVLRACLASYRGYADVRQYTTANTVEDLEDVRAFLGYPVLDLYGVSYGTRVAMLYTSRYRPRVASVILDSVLPPDNHVPFALGDDAERSLDLLVKDCSADSGCRSRFPDLGVRIQRLFAQLGEVPQHTTIRDARTGLDKEVTVTRAFLAQVLVTALYVPDWSAMVPLLIEQAEGGNFKGFFALNDLARESESTISKGLQYSVLCAEDVPAGLRIAAHAPEPSFLSRDAEISAAQLCAVWPADSAGAEDWHVETSDIPALLISGEFDPITPPSWAASVAARWRMARQLVVPGRSHNASASECVVDVMAAFLNDPNGHPDVSCVTRQRRPPFVLNESGPDIVSDRR